MYSIELHPLALKEMEDSYNWYEGRLEGLGNLFLTSMHKSFEQIAQHPDLYTKGKGKYRAYVMKEFLFTIIYEIMIKKRIVFISSIFHTKRNPSLKYKR